jgi:quinolinate synthase
MNVAKQTKKKILTWKGHCEVHERFTADELLAYKEADPTIEIIGHPECHPDVIAVCDYSGIDRRHDQLRQGHAAAEGAAGDRMLDGVEHPERGAEGVEFHQAVQSVPAHEAHHPAEDPRLALLMMTEESAWSIPAIADRARLAVERMINLKN